MLIVLSLFYLPTLFVNLNDDLLIPREANRHKYYKLVWWHYKVSKHFSRSNCFQMHRKNVDAGRKENTKIRSGQAPYQLHINTQNFIQPNVYVTRVKYVYQKVFIYQRTRPLFRVLWTRDCDRQRNRVFEEKSKNTDKRNPRPPSGTWLEQSRSVFRKTRDPVDFCSNSISLTINWFKKFVESILYRGHNKTFGIANPNHVAKRVN